jgi:hypothetical protein
MDYPSQRPNAGRPATVRVFLGKARALFRGCTDIEHAA